MRNYLLSSLALLGLLSPILSQASSPPPASAWPGILSLVRRCSAQTICVRQDGSRLASPLVSRCPEVTLDGAVARITYQGKTYRAEITESDQSDGGDLNDLVLVDSEGTSAERYHNVLGFNDVLLTLLGGDAATVRTTYQKCPKDL